jgi:hypothetical protein
MNSFDISPEWHLSDIMLYQMHIPSSELKEKKLEDIEGLLQWQGHSKKLRYSGACQEEGFLNIPVIRCSDDRCFIHLFGKINGKEFKTDAKLGHYSSDEFDIINDRIKTILFSSKQTFKRYYTESNVTAIKEHLTAFLFVF